MNKSKTYENFPWWIVLTSNFVSLAIYGLGLFIVVQLGLLFAVFFLLYILFFELRLIKAHCINCYYWGKACAFGKGSISSLFFKQGDTKEFCKKKMSWKDLVPDVLVSVIPIVIGIALLIKGFNFLLLLSMLFLVLLSTYGNGLIRGSLACKYCKQKELGCPAAQLFFNNKN